MAEDEDRLAEETLAWLREDGFREEERGESESFGDRYVRLSRAGLQVALVRDRGQWSLDAGGPRFGSRYAVHVWRIYLDGVDAPAAPTFGEQAEFVRTRLGEIEAAIESDPAIEARLLQMRKASADRRLDL